MRPCLAGFAHALADHAMPLAGSTARHDVLALVPAWWCVRSCLLRQRPDGLTWARQLVQQVVEICRHLTRCHPRWDREFGWRAPSEPETIRYPPTFLANHLKLEPVVDIEPHRLRRLCAASAHWMI